MVLTIRGRHFPLYSSQSQSFSKLKLYLYQLQQHRHHSHIKCTAGPFISLALVRVRVKDHMSSKKSRLKNVRILNKNFQSFKRKQEHFLLLTAQQSWHYFLMLRRFGKRLAYTVSGVSLAYCTFRYVCGIGKCEDISMEPAIQHGDVVLLTPFHVAHNKVVNGDIVFCRSPKNAASVICKRVIAMGGELVNNEDIGDQEYVGKGQVWLEGDNKDASIDSRAFGTVPYGLLLSKVSLRVWPPSRIGFMSNDYTNTNTEPASESGSAKAE